MEKKNIYVNGQIYAIRSHQTEEIYIGSTTQPLHKRFHEHKNNKRYYTSKEIIQYTDAYIELIENFPCNSKKELNRREGQHIRNAENCVNKRIPERSKKEFYVDNKEEIAKRNKEYYYANKDNHLEQKKIYYQENKDVLIKKRKIYIAANRDEINRKAREAYAAKKIKD
jgi:hypothetical protein